MNIAFPAVLLFLLVLPGFLLRSAFTKADGTNLDFKPFTNRTAFSIIFAAIIHSIWIYIFVPICSYQIHFNTLIDLLIGGNHTIEHREKILNEPTATFIYFITIYLFSYLGGRFFGALVRSLKWDRKSTFPNWLKWIADILKLDTNWYYLFSGINKEDSETLNIIGVYIAAVVTFKDTAYLYQGLLSDYYLDENGCLERIELKNVYRRPFIKQLDADAQEFSTSNENERFEKVFYKVKGHYFVLRSSEIQTLNIRYINTDDIRALIDELKEEAH